MSVKPLLPEIFIVAASMIILITRAVSGKAHRSIYAVIAFIGLLFGTGSIVNEFFTNGAGNVYAFSPDAQFMRLLFYIITALIILFWLGSGIRDREDPALFLSLVLINLGGCGFMAGVKDIVAMYCALELIFISSFFIIVLNCAGSSRGRLFEAAVKYFVLGVISSALVVFALSYLYGLTGSTEFMEVGAVLKGLQGGGLSIAAVSANGAALTAGVKIQIMLAVILLVGLAMKMGIAPFNYWLPDVLESGSVPLAAYMAVLPCGVFVILAINVIPALFGAVSLELSFYYALIAAFSLFVGSFMALRQSDLKRFMAYSSVIQTGFILLGIAAASSSGRSAVIFYFTVYALMNTGFFSMAVIMNNNGLSCVLSDLDGMRKNSLVLSIAAFAFLCSFGGVPLFGGFTGRFYSLMAVAGSGMFVLAAAGFIGWLLSGMVYLRMIKRMFIDESRSDIKLKISLMPSVVMVACLAGIIVLGIFPEWLMDFINVIRG